MSEQKCISPLLDGFTVGSPISDHDGVRSCPAIKDNTEKKYILKIISVPASQVQMDALLLAGAYKDPADAMDYYKEISEDIVREAELLKKLSKLEGFLPYDGWQIEPITRRRLGYEVYLISSYKRSLDKYLRKTPFTHLEAMNLALDICSALSVCRQAGSLYVDLKPTNIFVSDKKEYRIGDLGFLSLNALSYSALPDKYRSAYTPPEFDDPMAPLNTTADTYALGMILYQLFNDSQLPVRDAETGAVPSPVNADYELAEIIAKAIHIDPQERWQDPAAMGQAIVSYMQRNSVNDVPITHHIPLEAEEPAVSEQAEETSVTSEETSEALSEETASVEEAPVSEPEDDTVPGEEEADMMQPHEMSEELSKIVAKADDLIAHETPEGVVVPEPPELPDPFAFATEDSEDVDDSDIPVDPVMEEEPEVIEPVKEKKKKKSRKFVSPESKRKVRKFIASIVMLLILAAIGAGGYLYYTMYYLQPIEGITIDGTEQSLVVTVHSDVDDSMLRVICSDPYGNVRTKQLSGGQAAFTELLPDTAYTVELQIDGFHQLTGKTSDVFTTDANTKILSFTAVTGPEEGSAVLTFTADGDEPKEWTVIASAEGEKDIKEVFNGHTVTVKGLTVGKIYTFTLLPDDKLTLSGETTMQFVASRLILAENISVTSSNGTDMIIQWNAPGDVVVDSWDVRCYNIQGFEVQFTVGEPTAIIPGVDLSTGYTIEITASGMTQPSHANITANPINVGAFELKDAENPTVKDIEVTWQFDGDTPNGGWLLMYTVDGAATPNVIKCQDASAVIPHRIPGAVYRFTIQAADGTSVLNNAHRYECPATVAFEKHSLRADTVTAQTLKTPDDEKWRYETISDNDFTDTFTPGDRISVVLRAASPFYLPGSETQILYVYRDTHGNVLSDLISLETVYWKNIWSGGDAKTGELDVPTAPTVPGSYVLHIYIDGMTMAEIPVTVQ